MSDDKIIREVYEVLESRRDNPIDSYTSNIMKDSDKKAEDKILEKIAEEAGEVLIASKNDENLSFLADYIFEKVFKNYTMKQRGISAEEIDPNVMNRVPIVISKDNRYFPHQSKFCLRQNSLIRSKF